MKIATGQQKLSHPYESGKNGVLVGGEGSNINNLVNIHFENVHLNSR